MKNSQSIRSLFALPGFVVGAGLKGLFGDRYARVIQLKRRKKQLCALTVGNGAGGAMTSKCAGSATCRWQAGGSIWNTSVGEDVKELVETIISDSWSFPALRP